MAGATSPSSSIKPADFYTSASSKKRQEGLYQVVKNELKADGKAKPVTTRKPTGAQSLWFKEFKEYATGLNYKPEDVKALEGLYQDLATSDKWQAVFDVFYEPARVTGKLADIRALFPDVRPQDLITVVDLVRNPERFAAFVNQRATNPKKEVKPKKVIPMPYMPGLLAAAARLATKSKGMVVSDYAAPPRAGAVSPRVPSTPTQIYRAVLEKKSDLIHGLTVYNLTQFGRSKGKSGKLSQGAVTAVPSSKDAWFNENARLAGSNLTGIINGLNALQQSATNPNGVTADFADRMRQEARDWFKTHKESTVRNRGATSPKTTAPTVGASAGAAAGGGTAFAPAAASPALGAGAMAFGVGGR